MQFQHSRLATQLLTGLKGIEIGGSAHNPFGLDTKNVDRYGEMDTVYKKDEIALCGYALPVDVVANGDDLPFDDSSVDFVISSHVLEHFYDPIKALEEWYRVTRDGGYIYAIIPHKDRTFDSDRPRTTLDELLERHTSANHPTVDTHHSVWITEDVVELVNHLGWGIHSVQDTDDKVGNGFAIVINVRKDS